MFYIFVDTQAFERAGFGFNHATNLLALAQAAADGQVTVLLTEITDREVKEHIVRRVTKSLEKVKKEYVLQVLTVVDFSQWQSLDVDVATKNGIEEWERYKKDTSATMVSVDLAKPTVVMNAFFDVKPPFSEKKPNEFRDAFVLEALRTWAEREDQQVIVVSGDPDHKNTCDGVRLVHVETIDEALARTIDDAALLEAGRKHLQEYEEVIQDRLKDEIESLPVSADDDVDADVEGISISNFRLKPEDFELVEVRNNSALFAGVVGVNVEVFATIADYDNGMRDEGDWAYLPYNSVTYSRDIEARIAVRIPFEDGAPLELAPIDEISLEEPQRLDIDYRWETTMRQHWSEDDEPDEPEEEKKEAPK